ARPRVAAKEPPVDACRPFGMPLVGIGALDALEEDGGGPVPRAALPDTPRRQRPARARERVARADPRRDERRVLAREGNQQSRRTSRLGLAERRFVPESAHHALLAHERGRVAYAQQELRLDGKRFRPAPRRRIDVTQATAETQALSSARRASRRARRRARHSRHPRRPALPAASNPTSSPPAANAPSSAPASGVRIDRPGVSRTTVGSLFRKTTYPAPITMSAAAI